jgi:hypothetical protein
MLVGDTEGYPAGLLQHLEANRDGQAYLHKPRGLMDGKQDTGARRRRAEREAHGLRPSNLIRIMPAKGDSSQQ